MNNPSANQLDGLLWGTFIGDAFTLGAHWIYNPSKIERMFGRLSGYVDVPADSYHKGKQKGDFTHYGDQTLVLLESQKAGAFDLPAFADAWKGMWPGYSGYVDGATKGTLENFAQGLPPTESGSDSNDLAGASRLGVVVRLLAGQPVDDIVLAARTQTAMTHADAQVVDSAEFFSRVLCRVLDGETTAAALDAESTRSYADTPVADWFAKAKALVEDGTDTGPALQKLGLTCHVDEAFAAAVFVLLKHGHSFEEALIENTMAGGDSAARGMLIGAVLGAEHGKQAIPVSWIEGLNAREKINAGLGETPKRTKQETERVTFTNRDGEALDARLELPVGDPVAFAIFAHCFTCGKDIAAASRISRRLAAEGFAVLRFDFTGLGSSDGDFANTNFSSNVQDLVDAANFLTKQHESPSLLIGHSLGGAAVLAAAAQIESVKGVVTIGAPSDPGHVKHLFENDAPKIESDGKAEVSLGGRKFTIKKQFIEDITSQNVLAALGQWRGVLLIMHSPVDQTVSIDHAGEIYSAAKHPKSFISLDPADHLLMKAADSQYAADIIASWSGRFLETA
ncbi:MAG: alpha/beta fold hydrolase [Verrucomicrobiota bacterium]